MPLVKRSTKGSPLTIAEMDANWDYATLGGYTYTEVAITSGSILSMGSTPIELLPAPGANKYYDVDTIVIEYTLGGTPYTADDKLYIDGIYVNLYNPLTYGDTNKVIVIDGKSPQGMLEEPADSNAGYSLYFVGVVNTSVTLSTWTGANPTSGDGTLLVKIWYKVRTFGTEL